MKYLSNRLVTLMLVIATIISTFFVCHSQPIEGKWEGVLKMKHTVLHLVASITNTKIGLKTVLDSPDQDAIGIPLRVSIYTNPKLIFEAFGLRIVYEGEFLSSKKFTGNFNQFSQSFLLKFERQTKEIKAKFRPQEPNSPLPYRQEDVICDMLDGHFTVGDTPSLPDLEAPFPKMLLISGNEPHHPNEAWMRQKPLLALSDHITRNDTGVLYCDDIGTGTFGSFSLQRNWIKSNKLKRQ